MKEEFRDILGYEGRYQVSNIGRVWSLLRKKFLRPQHHGVYLNIGLCKDGKRHFLYIHRLVLAAFIGPCPDGQETCHEDGNPENNCIFNLRWGTRFSNQNDRVKHGTSNRGERHWKAKLNNSKVKHIRKLVKSGFSQTEVGKLFDISLQAVNKIISYENWKHI